MSTAAQRSRSVGGPAWFDSASHVQRQEGSLCNWYEVRSVARRILELRGGVDVYVLMGEDTIFGYLDLRDADCVAS